MLPEMESLLPLVAAHSMVPTILTVKWLSRLVSVPDLLSRTAEVNQISHSLIPGNLKINDNAHLLCVDKKEKIEMTSIVQAFLPPVVPGRRLLCRLHIFTPQ